MPTTGAFSCRSPVEPKNPASPKANNCTAPPPAVCTPFSESPRLPVARDTIWPDRSSRPTHWQTSPASPPSSFGPFQCGRPVMRRTCSAVSRLGLCSYGSFQEAPRFACAAASRRCFRSSRQQSYIRTGGRVAPGGARGGVGTHRRSDGPAGVPGEYRRRARWSCRRRQDPAGLGGAPPGTRARRQSGVGRGDRGRRHHPLRAGRAPAAPAGETPSTLLDLLRRTADGLAERTKGGALVLGVDDAHLLDPPSAALLHHLALTGAGSVLLTLRSDAASPDAITGLWKDGLVERVDVGPLSPPEVERLLGLAVDGQVDGATVRQFWELCRGNALFLRELTVGALEEGTLAPDGELWRARGPLGQGVRLAEVIQARLGRLGEDDRTAAEVIALGEPLGVGLLEMIVGGPALEAADRAGLVEVLPDAHRLHVRLAHPGWHARTTSTTRSPNGSRSPPSTPAVGFGHVVSSPRRCSPRVAPRRPRRYWPPCSRWRQMRTRHRSPSCGPTRCSGASARGSRPNR